jgi:maltooligosyltrehalose synthase
VTQYTTNPQLGSDADISGLRARLNSMGLKLMLDFVPNHSAVDGAALAPLAPSPTHLLLVLLLA